MMKLRNWQGNKADAFDLILTRFQQILSLKYNTQETDRQ